MAHQMLSILCLFLLSFLNGSHGLNISVYWGHGEHDNIDEGTLAQACESGNYEIVVIGSVYKFGNNQTMEINLGNHCYPDDQGCAALSSQIEYCQSLGVKVFVSIGGAQANLTSEWDCTVVAYELWSKFLGGKSADRPLGNAVLDGVDFYVEGSPTRNTSYWGVLAKELLVWSRETKVYLSATPQCVFPDYYLNDALQTGLFDYVWPEFYDNSPCEYTGTEESIERLENAWQEWTRNINATFFLGLPASNDSGAATSGYIPPGELIDKILPIVSNNEPEFGGVMLWDRFYDKKTNYSSYIKNYPNVTVSDCAIKPLSAII
ncbi:hypothetical protein F0562_015024 [Nyssa sinensis]|uniref:GH18 domain-containing protein n=1 Tax=Nyssa sinensis TaxID=561372 RepID=A0A5J4ZS94_9ASTE|nr:hypothetical protein F0562_015024 [Nyssa sinensis]